MRKRWHNTKQIIARIPTKRYLRRNPSMIYNSYNNLSLCNSFSWPFSWVSPLLKYTAIEVDIKT